MMQYLLLTCYRKAIAVSRNNILVGLLGMRFGWHNNHHHAHPRKLILAERWWEVDGYIAWALSKTAKKSG